MDTVEMAVGFANIFMGEIEKQILNESAHRPLARERYIDDIISLWHTSRDAVEKFIEQANKRHPTIKFTADISCTDATFLDTTIYKGQRFHKESVLDTRMHFKPTETFHYTFFTTCHPPGSQAKKDFVKGEALRLHRTNSSNRTFEENITTLKKTPYGDRLSTKLYQQHTLRSEIWRKDISPPPTKQNKRTDLALRNTIPRSSSKSQRNLNEKWHVIQQQPLLNQIFKEPPIISYRKGRSLKDILVRAKL